MNGTRGLVIAMLAAFIVGCSLGMAGGIVFARFVVTPQTHQLSRLFGPGPGAPHGQAPVLGMLERRLRLTPEQKDRVDKILEDSRRGYAVVRESTSAAIERELTPGQRDEWKQMEERFLRERRHGSGRPPWRGSRP
jgi:hypothetical protein